MSPTGLHVAAKPRIRRMRSSDSWRAARRPPVHDSRPRISIATSLRIAPGAWFQTTDDGPLSHRQSGAGRGSTAMPVRKSCWGGLPISVGQLYVDSHAPRAFVRSDERERRGPRLFESQVYRRGGSIIWITETCREVRTTTGRFLIMRARSRTSARGSVPKRRCAAPRPRPRRRSAAVELPNLDLERRVAERTAELR